MIDSLWLRLTLLGVVAYLIGGISWASIIGRAFYHVDVRTEGSGNLGATNVFRVLGVKAGVATLVLDMVKGAVAVGLAFLFVPSASYGSTTASWAEVVAAFFVILGHSYSPYLRFSGGKGVATAAGALFVMTPVSAVIMLAVFFAVTWWTSMVSAGSITIAALYPFSVVLLYDELPLVLFAFAGAGLVLWRHRSNMQRILAGNERRISWGRHHGSDEDR